MPFCNTRRARVRGARRVSDFTDFSPGQSSTDNEIRSSSKRRDVRAEENRFFAAGRSCANPDAGGTGRHDFLIVTNTRKLEKIHIRGAGETFEYLARATPVDRRVTLPTATKSLSRLFSHEDETKIATVEWRRRLWRTADCFRRFFTPSWKKNPCLRVLSLDDRAVVRRRREDEEKTARGTRRIRRVTDARRRTRTRAVFRHSRGGVFRCRIG